LVLLSTPTDGNRFCVTVRKILDARKVKESGLAGQLQPGATFRIKQTRWELASRNGCSWRDPSVAPMAASSLTPAFQQTREAWVSAQSGSSPKSNYLSAGVEKIARG
jgi:hypothetical protein